MQDQLEAKLNLLFDKKIAKLDSKAGSIIKDIEKAKERFGHACDRFEALDAEPYIEGLYSINISSVKGQKVPYAKTLRRIIQGIDLGQGGKNYYDKYMSIFVNVDEAATAILKANSGFKLVMYCYANHLSDFKNSFKTIEQLRDNLKKELDARSIEFSEYKSLSAEISKIVTKTGEAHELGKRIESMHKELDPHHRQKLDGSNKELSEELFKKRAESAAVHAKISEVTNEISALTIPLERPAKKFDHLNPRKDHLHEIVSDPESHIKSQADFDRLKTRIFEFKDAVEKGEVDVKNRQEAIDNANVLLNSNLHSMIESLKSHRRQRAMIEEQVGSIERRLDDVKRGITSIDKSAEEIKKIEREKDDILGSRVEIKKRIEEKFLAYYKKLVSVII